MLEFLTGTGLCFQRVRFFIHSFMYALIYSFMHLYIYLFIQCMYICK